MGDNFENLHQNYVVQQQSFLQLHVYIQTAQHPI